MSGRAYFGRMPAARTSDLDVQVAGWHGAAAAGGRRRRIDRTEAPQVRAHLVHQPREAFAVLPLGLWGREAQGRRPRRGRHRLAGGAEACILVWPLLCGVWPRRRGVSGGGARGPSGRGCRGDVPVGVCGGRTGGAFDSHAISPTDISLIRNRLPNHAGGPPPGGAPYVSTGSIQFLRTACQLQATGRPSGQKYSCRTGIAGSSGVSRICRFGYTQAVYVDGRPARAEDAGPGRTALSRTYLQEW